MKILALGGSIRSNPKSREFLLDLVHRTKDLKDFQNVAREYTKKEGDTSKKMYLTNTEICAAAALAAAKNEGIEVDYFTLTSLYQRREMPLGDMTAEQLGLHDETFTYDYLQVDEKLKNDLVEKVRSSTGIITASPVYFGDRSSISNKFLQISLSENLLEQKVLASVSAGAKRNGGQETANIFYLNEARLQGAYIVGNGPKSAQYGGTAVAGDIGDILNDAWGIETCYATGIRVSQAVKMLSTPVTKVLSRKANVVVLVTMDNPKRNLFDKIKEKCVALAEKNPNINIKIVQLLDGQIERCLACNICPIPEKLKTPTTYACIIKTKRDSMETIREDVLNADGLILAGVNYKDMNDIFYRYQAFTERTRFIRRNDFELTNVPVTSYILEEAGAQANNLFDLKVMTSYMRHNTVVCPPIREVFFNKETVVDSTSRLQDFLTRVEMITTKRSLSSGIDVSYKAGGDGGYKDNRLDNTKAIRY